MHHYHFFKRVCPLLVVCILLPLFSTAQTVLFEETMGVPAANTPVGDYSGFDNYGTAGMQFSSTSTTDVRSSSASNSSYYPAASGNGNVFVNDTNEDFIITGISVDGFSALSLSFGLWKGSIAEDGSNLTIEVIIDGGTPVTVPLGLPTGPGTAVWHYQTPVLNLPAGNRLSLRFNGESSSAFRIDDILITGVASPTPVVLRSFMAMRKGRTAQLEWETVQEKNSAYYEIQQSRDGHSFYALNRVPSQNDPLGAQYSFTDPDPSPGRNYYRIKMTDFDEKKMYSPIRMVTLPANRQPIRLLENPVSHLLKIKIPERATTYRACRLYNLEGRQLPVLVKQDGLVLTADVTGLRAGIYIIKLEAQAGVHTIRFLKR